MCTFPAAAATHRRGFRPKVRPRGLRRLALLAALLRGVTSAQSPAPAADAAPSVFVAADVHPSPHTMYPFVRATFARGLFTMRQATLVDLIAKAYGVDPGNVTGGPNWLEFDRFDIYAKAPPAAPPEALSRMLVSLLHERFHLVLHTGSRPMPAFVLTPARGGPKLAESDGLAAPDCRYIDPPADLPAGAVSPIAFSCHNASMADLVENLHDWAGGYLPSPVVDRTGLKASYDFNLRWTPRPQLARAGADGITIFGAVEKQLGLRLELGTAQLPVVVIDSVDRTPSPNPQNLATLMPPQAPPEFEVATIRPNPTAERMNGNLNGTQINLQGATLAFMVTFAYDVSREMLVNAPGWLDTARFDVLAKAPAESFISQPNAPPIDDDDLRLMLRRFLEVRFKLAVHIENRPLDAYTLLAPNSKLKRANPANRSSCKEGPGDDGRDPRLATPILNRLLTCRNVTMAQFAEQMQVHALSYIHTPVLDGTGLPGTYDLTVSFSAPSLLRTAPAAGADPNAPSASEPSGALSFFNALNKQLGLKLVLGKRPVSALVIDHIEEQPTEN